MGPGVILLQALLNCIAMSYLLIGWMGIRRHIRYFKLEGYNISRYLIWWQGNRKEMRFLIMSFILVLLLALAIPATVAIVGFLASPDGMLASSSALVNAVIVLSVVSIILVSGLLK